MKLKITWWKFSALILSWVLLAIFLTLVNRTEQQMTLQRWQAIAVGSCLYLIWTSILFNPLTHKTNENKIDP